MSDSIDETGMHLRVLLQQACWFTRQMDGQVSSAYMGKVLFKFERDAFFSDNNQDHERHGHIRGSAQKLHWATEEWNFQKNQN